MRILNIDLFIEQGGSKGFVICLAIAVMYQLITGCNFQEDSKTMGFANISDKKSSLLFSNDITTSDTLNYNTFPYIYMGGGVAFGDINNDGLADIFFTGNMVDNKLYLNKGGLHFDDITQKSKIAGDSRWYTGVTMVDINEDGWLDIYVCVSGVGSHTANQLYINNGDLTFTEKAREYGIADESNSIQSTFFDYDNDGDLDLFVVNYPTIPLTLPNSFYKQKMLINDPEESGHLFKNNGNGSFENVTDEAGLLNFGLSLGVVASDLNNDGWNDLYVSNDFNVPDYLYINKGDGSFRESIKESTQQTSFFGMGIDAADFDNNGLMDLIQLDMTPADHFRSKTNMASMDANSFYSGVKMGFHYQYMQNSLQMNNGTDGNGNPIFSNIALFSGVATTDWSWGTLFADFDNDGLKDIVITNGMRLDVNNNDFLNKGKNRTTLARPILNMDEAPVTPIDNYIFQNMGDYGFEDVSKSWNADVNGFSNGVAYGDLDNDGDLDLVINNIDQKATLLENKLTQSNYLRIRLKGTVHNPIGIGAKVKVVAKSKTQWAENSPTRGFQSSVEPIVHFGLGEDAEIDTVQVTWPDGTYQTVVNPAINQQMEIAYARNVTNRAISTKETKFKDISEAKTLDFSHKENFYNDLAAEPLLPHQYSRFGPPLAAADVNNDGLDDFFMGNAKESAGGLYLQTADGQYVEMEGPWLEDTHFEDTGTVLADFNNDGKIDLYVVSGGNNTMDDFQDRLYLNTENGFEMTDYVLPKIDNSGMEVSAVDYDQDGDMDIFIGGRIVPGKYPLPASSYLLRNDLETGRFGFTNVTEDVFPQLLEIGLVTSAVWRDFTMDGLPDLVLAGEWMPIRLFKNKGSSFEELTDSAGLLETQGWWFSIKVSDLDNDGDMDIVGGNLGLNSKYKASANTPFEVYSNDFDGNGRLDIVLSHQKKGVKLPVRGRECSSQQIPAIAERYKTFTEFAKADINDIYGKKVLANSISFSVRDFSHGWFENQGNNTFVRHQLPNMAQFSSINAIIEMDYNHDDYPDFVIAGNLYETEPETPRNDASVGLILKNIGGRGFMAIPPNESGIMVKGCVRDMVALDNKEKILFGINDQSPRLFLRLN